MKEIETIYTTHQRMIPEDKKFLKENYKKEEMSSPANFLHYIIQFYKANIEQYEQTKESKKRS